MHWGKLLRSLTLLILVLGLAGCTSGTTTAQTSHPSAVKTAPRRASTPNHRHRNPYAHWQHVNQVVLPILMYHSISTGNALRVPAKEFSAQMAYLKRHHYQTLTTTQAVYALKHHRVPRGNFVWVTLDDSYKDNLTAAWPILKRNHQHATINFITGFTAKKTHLDLAEAKRMQASGAIDFQSHTVRHLDLNELTYRAQLTELTSSKRWLDQRLHQQTQVICYPAGRADGETIRAAKAAKYQYALSTAPGLATSRQDPYNLTRQRVVPGMSLTGFAALLH